MGKEYFEFLEEEFQALTAQLQKALGNAQHEFDVDSKGLEQQITRCGAICQQMRVESRTDPEFEDRCHLYQIQLRFLENHFSTEIQRQEVEIAFDQDGTLLGSGAQGEEFPAHFQARPALGYKK